MNFAFLSLFLRFKGIRHESIEIGLSTARDDTGAESFAVTETQNIFERRKGYICDLCCRNMLHVRRLHFRFAEVFPDLELLSRTHSEETIL